jgi:hypothetical protein
VPLERSEKKMYMPPDALEKQVRSSLYLAFEFLGYKSGK